MLSRACPICQNIAYLGIRQIGIFWCTGWECGQCDFILHTSHRTKAGAEAEYNRLHDYHNAVRGLENV